MVLELEEFEEKQIDNVASAVNNPLQSLTTVALENDVSITAAKRSF